MSTSARATRNESIAVDHLCANADEDTGALAALSREASGVSGSAEWKDWAEQDPKRAEDAAHYVFAYSNHAQTDKNWWKALQDYNRSLELDELRRQARDDQA